VFEALALGKAIGNAFERRFRKRLRRLTQHHRHPRQRIPTPSHSAQLSAIALGKDSGTKQTNVISGKPFWLLRLEGQGDCERLQAQQALAVDAASGERDRSFFESWIRLLGRLIQSMRRN
jgi:hypothetical protein